MPLSIKDYAGPKIPQYIEGTLAAGAMRGLDAVGEKFYVIESDGTLTIKTSNGTKNTFDQRQGENANADALYERIEIYNETGAPITFRIFYGFGEFYDGRADIIGTVSITGVVPLPTGAATAANQDAEAVLVGAVNEAAPATDTANSGLNGRLQRIAQRLTSLIALVPAALDAAGRFKIGKNALGAQGNAWLAAATGAGGFSAALDTLDASIVSAFGNVNGATTLTVQVSEDNATYYDTATTVVLGGAGDFHTSFTTAAKYVRLKSSNNVNATATLAAKS